MAADPHPLTVKAAVKLLTATMGDPMKAGVCSIRMGVASDRIDQALEACDSVSTKIKFAKSYPELLRAGIQFLTFNQSPKEHMAMVKHLNKCYCDFGQNGMRRLHKPGRHRLDGRITVGLVDLVFDAVTTVSNLIILSLSELTQHKFRTGNANNGERRWPQGPEDLLPFGPKGSIAGLELWVAGAPYGYIIFKLAGRLASFHTPFAKEIFQYPKFSFASGRPYEHLGAAIKFYDEGDASPLAREHFFTYPVTTIFQFFDDLSQLDSPTYNTMITARGSWLKPILYPLARILSTLPPEWRKIRIHLNYITSYANVELDPETGFGIVKFDRSQFEKSTGQHDALEDAYNTIVYARKRGCWNIQCPSGAEAIHSRLCSKCNLIRFCGEKCQKDAWKSGPLPHKAICAKIYLLKESLGNRNWSLLWDTDFRYAQFKVMCRENQVDTEALKLISSTISALRIRKSTFAEDMKKAGESQEERLKRAEKENLARQTSKKFVDSLGEQVTVIPNREEGFLKMHPDAYALGRTIKGETNSDDVD